MSRGRPSKAAVTVSRGDWGPGTEAAKRGTVIEVVPEDKNGTKRRRRPHALEVMQRDKVLNAIQYAAGMEISQRYEATLTGPPAINENPVDSFPDYGAIIVSKLEIKHQYAAAVKVVPPHAREVVFHVCCDGRAIRDGLCKGGKYATAQLGNLKRALDMVARSLGLQ